MTHPTPSDDEPTDLSDPHLARMGNAARQVQPDADVEVEGHDIRRLRRASFMHAVNIAQREAGEARAQLRHERGMRAEAQASAARAIRRARFLCLAAMAGWALAVLFLFLAVAHAGERTGPWRTGCVGNLCASVTEVGDGSLALELGYLVATRSPFLALVMPGAGIRRGIGTLRLEVDGTALQASRAIVQPELIMMPLTEDDMAAIAAGHTLSIIGETTRLDLSLAGSAAAIAAARDATEKAPRPAPRPAPSTGKGEVTI